MDQVKYELDDLRRSIVLAALKERCRVRDWQLLAAHVRSTHVHVVVDAEETPERVMLDLKAFASKRLNHAGTDAPDRKRWARHGSTRWLWEREGVEAAVRYVVCEQGEPMAVFDGWRLG